MKSKTNADEKTDIWFRVLPIDSEFLYMNAARFFSFMEIAQYEQNVRNGFVRSALRKKWWVVVRSKTMFYKKGIKCDILTEIFPKMPSGNIFTSLT